MKTKFKNILLSMMPHQFTQYNKGNNRKPTKGRSTQKIDTVWVKTEDNKWLKLAHYDRDVHGAIKESKIKTKFIRHG